MKTVSIPTVEEDVRKVLTSSPIERKSKQYDLIRQCGIVSSGTTPYLDYINHLQRINEIDVCEDIQPALWSAIENDPQTKQFLMIIS